MYLCTLIIGQYLSSKVGDLVLKFLDFVGLVHGGGQVALRHLLLILKWKKVGHEMDRLFLLKKCANPGLFFV